MHVINKRAPIVAPKRNKLCDQSRNDGTPVADRSLGKTDEPGPSNQPSQVITLSNTSNDQDDVEYLDDDDDDDSFCAIGYGMFGVSLEDTQV